MPKGYPGTKKTNGSPSKTGGRTATGKFAKGNSYGNGRPVLGRSLAQLIKDLGEEKLLSEDGTIEMSRLEYALRKCWKDAATGDRAKLELLLDRGWGKVPNQVDFTDWRKQAQDAGFKDEVDAIFNAVVDEFATRSAGSDEAGSVGASAS